MEQYEHIVVVSALIMRDAAGAILIVRKEGTSKFMLPGGKIEPGETPAETVVREAAEEISVTLDQQKLRFVGEFLTDATNEPGWGVRAYVFEHPFVADWKLAGEIAEAQWLDAEKALPSNIGPLLSDALLPVLRQSV